RGGRHATNDRSHPHRRERAVGGGAGPLVRARHPGEQYRAGDCRVKGYFVRRRFPPRAWRQVPHRGAGKRVPYAVPHPRALDSGDHGVRGEAWTRDLSEGAWRYARGDAPRRVIPRTNRPLPRFVVLTAEGTP